MKNEYGIQLYSIRDLTSENLASALEVVADAGYKSVEFAGFFSHTSDEVRSMLDKLNLSAIGSHIKWTELAPDKIYDLMDYHETIGCKNLIIPAFDNKEETLEKMIECINFAEKILKERGFSLGYHNHSFEFIETDYGKRTFYEIAERTNADLEIDVFWAYNAGVDPIELMRKYKNRIKMIHLKDGVAERESSSGKPEGRYVGSGNVPIKEIIDYATDNAIYMIVESEDLNPSGSAEIRACMDYLKIEG